MAPLGEVEAVAHGAADAVVLGPLEMGQVDAALKHQVLDEAAHGVVHESGDDRGPEAEAAPQAAGHVVLAAAFPDLEAARGVDAALAGIEAEHHLAQAHEVPSARGGVLQREVGHARAFSAPGAVLSTTRVAPGAH
jgi:hypothetical protein